MNFIDNLLGRRPDTQTSPKIDPKSRTRVDNELAVARFTGTEEERIALAKTLDIHPREVPEIMRTHVLRNNPNAAHISAQNIARYREQENDAKRAIDPRKTPRSKTT